MRIGVRGARSGRIELAVQKVDSAVEVEQNTVLIRSRQLRIRSAALLVAVVSAAPLAPAAAQQEQRVVRELQFEGNHALDSYTLSSAIATSNSSWFATSWLVRWLGLGAKRTFDEQEFRRDVVRLILLYRQSGYMRVEVDTSVRRTAKDVFITFQIREGPPVRVTALEITGLAGVMDTGRLRRELPLSVGHPFDRFLMQASADTIATRLHDSGYPDAEVLRNFTSDADSLRATVRFDAVPGTFTRIGTIQVQGLERIDSTTVLRSLTLHPHDVFRQNQLYE